MELLDVEGMSDSLSDQSDSDQGEKYWDSLSIGKLRDRVEGMNRERKKEGKKEVGLKVDEELEEREREEREWEERRRARSRGGRGRGARGRR